MLGLAHVLVVEVAVQLTDHGEAVFQGWIPGATFQVEHLLHGRVEPGKQLLFLGVLFSVNYFCRIAVAGEEGQLGTGRGLHPPNDEPHRRGVGLALEGV